MASLVLHLLTILLGVSFTFLGHIKLTPQFFPEYHEAVRNEFGKLNKAFPLYDLTGWRPLAKNYRLGLGVAEMASGTLLLLGGAFSQSLANSVLLVILMNIIIAFQRLHYPMEYMGAAIFLTFLLAVRLVLASRSRATRPVRAAKRSADQKVD